MTIRVSAESGGFGACVEGIQLTDVLTPVEIAQLRTIWLKHQVIYFPNQPLTHEQLERFSRYFGPFGDDPFVEHLDEHSHVLEVRREPGEQASPFGSTWHSDWSFQKYPPIATMLHSKIIPPVGGATCFADSHRAYDALPEAKRRALEDLIAIHSARRPYTMQGFLAAGGHARSMKIHPSDKAMDTQEHPVITMHPETGRKSLWVNSAYTIGIKDWCQQRSDELLRALCDHATQTEFVYVHQWEPDMLCIWDNRCTQHCAQGGYDGFRRVMHRTVVGAAPNIRSSTSGREPSRICIASGVPSLSTSR